MRSVVVRCSGGVAILLVTEALVGACTADQMPRLTDAAGAEETTTVVALGEPSVLSVPDCDDVANVEAGCIFGFHLEDRFYAVSCSAVRSESVTAHVVGVGFLADRDVTVNLIEGVDRSVMVAVSLPGGECGYVGESHTAWSMAFSDADDEALQRAVCQVGALTPAQRTNNSC